MIYMLDIYLLGCGGSLPVPYRSLTALLVNYKGRKLLIDCGEGTQVSMKIISSGFKSIDIICFTHAHADHVIGLPGLLLTIANAGREEPLYIISPPNFKKIMEGLMVVCPILPFEVRLIECENASTLTFNDLTISTLPVDHTLPCNAYSLKINRQNKFDLGKAEKNKVPKTIWNKLQKGETVSLDGIAYTPDMVLGEPREGLRIAYSTDTRPTDSLVEFVRGSNLFICEGMYGEDSDLEKAIANKHMLFSEAANIAKNAEVKELWLTHFSPSILEPESFHQNATKIFENTIIGKDRLFKTLDFS
jgi:ribonuclease Z